MADRDSTLTQQRLKELLDYNAETGVFTWRIRRGMALAGSVAGNVRPDGRITIYIDGKPHEAARLAWLYVHGSFPNKKLKRKNDSPSDNRIANFYDPRIPMPKVIHAPLTADRLRELVNYDPETGVFTRRKVISKVGAVGEIIGYLKNSGRIEISIDGEIYLAHRLAWLYMTGNWPKHTIDHIDNNPQNNVFSNLRDIPHMENVQNIRRARPDSNSGILGVRKRGNKWRSEITVDGKVTFLGSFATAEEASAAYIEAKRRLHAGCTI